MNRLRDKALSTAGQVQAEAEGITIWDQEMNRVYKRLLRQLPKDQQSLLKSSQEQWIKFRDSNEMTIREIYGRADGTMYRPLAVRAQLQVIRERAFELRDYLEIVESAWP